MIVYEEKGWGRFWVVLSGGISFVDRFLCCCLVYFFMGCGVWGLLCWWWLSDRNCCGILWCFWFCDVFISGKFCRCYLCWNWDNWLVWLVFWCNCFDNRLCIYCLCLYFCVFCVWLYWLLVFVCWWGWWCGLWWYCGYIMFVYWICWRWIIGFVF